MASSQEFEVQTSDGMSGSLPSSEVVGERLDAYQLWISRIGRPQPDGHGFVATKCETVHWTPLSKELAECTVALVSTGGVHSNVQEPYDVYTELGDWSCRPIPGDVDTLDLTVTHTHYATADALKDINVMFPLDRLRELQEDGFIGQVSTRHYGLMGFIPDPGALLKQTVPEVVHGLREHDVDVVLLTAG